MLLGILTAILISEVKTGLIPIQKYALLTTLAGIFCRFQRFNENVVSLLFFCLLIDFVRNQKRIK
jgi:hypothetical protein